MRQLHSKKGRRYIMNGEWRIGDEWTWPSFLSAMASGHLDGVARQVEHHAREPLVLIVDASHVPVPAGPGDADIHSLTFPRDIVAFRYSADTLSPLEASYNADLLRPLASATTLQALALAIFGLPDLDKFWIDVGLGLRFRTLTTDQSAGPDTWDARALWGRALSPWHPWFR